MCTTHLPLMGNMNKCAETDMPDGLGKAIGIFLVIATLLASLPQVLKLLKAKSSEGVAPLTLCLITTFSGTNLASAIVVKWRQFQACRQVPPDNPGLPPTGAACFWYLLDVQQQISSALVFGTLLMLVVYYPPHNTRNERALALFTLTLVLILCALSCVLSSGHGRSCSQSALAYAQGVGVLSATCAFTAYVPQIVDTWRVRGAGALSPLFLAIQVCGCLLVVYNQVIVNKDPPPVRPSTSVPHRHPSMTATHACDPPPPPTHTIRAASPYPHQYPYASPHASLSNPTVTSPQRPDPIPTQRLANPVHTLPSPKPP